MEMEIGGGTGIGEAGSRELRIELNCAGEEVELMMMEMRMNEKVGMGTI
jgi:hypothetical protein